MENASKALIIAGAILLSILIIGLGMFIYNQAADAMKDTGMDQQKVQAYNSEFTSYEGTKVGTQVRTLCNIVAAHNRSAADDSEKIGIIYGSAGKEKTKDSLTDDVTEDEINAVLEALYQGKRYDISFNYGQSGQIVGIKVEDHT